MVLGFRLLVSLLFSKGFLVVWFDGSRTCSLVCCIKVLEELVLKMYLGYCNRVFRFSSFGIRFSFWIFSRIFFFEVWCSCRCCLRAFGSAKV